MSPLFGGKDQQKEEALEEWRQALEAEFDRLDSLSLGQLGAEVMTAACERLRDEVTVGGTALHIGPTSYGCAKRMMESKGLSFPRAQMKDRELQERIMCLVAEGLQQLEHASLVRLQVEDQTSYGSGYWLTRRGRTAFERGEVEDILTAATG